MVRATNLRSGEDEATDMLLASIMAVDSQLALTPEERKLLIDDVLNYQEIYGELVGKKLKEASFDGAKLTLTIAPFPEEGKALRDKFLGTLATHFPGGRFEQIDDYLGNDFDQLFRGFGITLRLSRLRPHLEGFL